MDFDTTSLGTGVPNPLGRDVSPAGFIPSPSQSASDQRYPSPDNEGMSSEGVTNQKVITNRSGFGDFCFADLTRWENEFKESPEYNGMIWFPQNKQLILSRTMNDRMDEWGNIRWADKSPFVDIVELTQYRVGVFPFFKLPIEVRQRVYRLLLRQFFDKAGDFNVCLTSTDRENPTKYDEDVEDYLTRNPFQKE